MVDDTNYITPHEAALAVVATSMKKARLHITTLILNALMGGFLFSSGSMLYIIIHSNNPITDSKNPGFLDMLGGISFGIGLFYVVIMGVDLYNSNILYFSVGLLRRAVSIWDLLISWFISLFGNVGGSLFMSYVLVHLSTISKTPNVVRISKEIGESKAHPNFIEVFLKGCGGNFFVCLAIYLQMMAKPLHVKFLMLVLPVFTFVTIGFSHTVADMGIMFTAMLNGVNVSVAEYIWRVLIPTALGNAVGGFSFSLILPFYLHLVVVERDRKKLSLPTYEARDEQPELNVDSRVVRISSREREEFSDADEAALSNTGSTAISDTDYYNEKNDPRFYEHASLTHKSSIRSRHPVTNTASNTTNATGNIPSSKIESHTNNDNILKHENSFNDLDSSMYNPSVSLYSNNSDMASTVPESYFAGVSSNPNKDNQNLSNKSSRCYTVVSRDGKRHIRSPPGVFPVRGMGTPLIKEKHIEDPTHIEEELESMEDARSSQTRGDGLLSRIQTASSRKHNVLERIKTIDKEEREDYKLSGGYDVEHSKPSAQLMRVLTRIVSGKHPATESNDIESGTTRTTQSPFPYNNPDNANYYDVVSTSETIGSGIKSIYSQKRRSFRDVGITDRAAMMANNIAGVDNYDPADTNQHNMTRQMSRFPSNITKRISELSIDSALTPYKTSSSLRDSISHLNDRAHTPNGTNRFKKDEHVTTFSIGEKGEIDSSDESKSKITMNSEN